MATVSIKDAILEFVRQLELKQRNAGGFDPQVCLLQAISKKEARHIKFDYLRNGALGLIVDSSAWMYEFNLKKEALLSAFRKQDTTIKNIYFRLGEVNGKRT